MKDMTLQVERLEEQNMNPAAVNESVWVTIRESIARPMNHFRPKRLTKDTEMIAESTEEQYVCIGLHIESMFTAWCLKEVGELQNFRTQTKQNWM